MFGSHTFRGALTRIGWLFIALTLCSALKVSLLQASENESDALGNFIEEQMKSNHIPGLAAAAVYSGEIIWVGTYGLGNIEDQIPVTGDTLFQLASVSKPITATVLLSFNEQSSWLDQDINDYLSFAVRNPNHPDIPITARQLLRHRSSITDNLDYLRPFWHTADGDPTASLSAHLRNYLSVGGENYSAQDNFLLEAPGTTKAYCNTCYALLGYIAESLSGEPFELLSQKVLFEPLGMNDTAWFLRDIGDKDIAMPYRFDASEGYIAYGHNGYPDWPAGQLRTSVNDIASYLAAYANGGMSANGRVIDQTAIDILSPQDPELGFHTWYQRAFSNGQIVYQHGGGDIGVRTYMALDRTEWKGVVVLSNGEGSVASIAERVFLAIDSLLDEY